MSADRSDVTNSARDSDAHASMPVRDAAEEAEVFLGSALPTTVVDRADTTPADAVSGQKTAAAARVVADRGLVYAAGIARQGEGGRQGGCGEEAAAAAQDAAPEAADAATDAAT